MIRWRWPWWRRRPADAPRPWQHGPRHKWGPQGATGGRVAFRGDSDGITIGGLS